MNREMLETPFGQNEIKTRKGTFGKSIDYVEAHAVIQRLNDAFDGQWSFEIVKHEILDFEVIVLGKLTAGGIVKTQFGSSSITKTKETGQIISIADDLKSAGTDSLKKAATMLGVGLHLYAGKENQQVTRKEQHRSASPSHQYSGRITGHHKHYSSTLDNEQRNIHHSTGNSFQDNNSRLTQKQHSLILNLAGDRGYTSKSLDDYSREAFGCVVDFLSKNDASAMINNFLSN